MNHQCPNCGSDRLYRNNPKSLEIVCENCNHKFQGKQTLKPIIEGEVYRFKNPKGKHTIKVWLCPKNQSKYSFSISYGSGVAYFKEFEEDPGLSGCYDSPAEALEAGKTLILDL